MEINELKSGMAKLIEMMQVLISRGEPPQRTVISEIPTTAVDTQPIQHTYTTWPKFGLPQNYSPPIAITSMVGQSSRPVFQALVFIEPQPIVHSASRQPAAQAAFGDPLFEYHAASPRSMSQGDFGEFEEFKEQYQTLEKRL